MPKRSGFELRFEEMAKPYPLGYVVNAPLSASGAVSPNGLFPVLHTNWSYRFCRIVVRG